MPWLLKTEPSTYSFSDLQRDKKTTWDGITNAAALKHMRSATVGDDVLIYHTGDERQVVGRATIIARSSERVPDLRRAQPASVNANTKAAYPDPKDSSLAVVDLKVGAPLKNAVTLAQLKDEKIFRDSPLVKQGRLSFVPLTQEQFAHILLLGS